MTIKEAAKALDIKEHVLRYWEEELNLNISRNDMGYREYSDRDVEMFKNISMLRHQGLGLKEIRDGIIATRLHTVKDEASAELPQDSHTAGSDRTCPSDGTDIPDGTSPNNGTGLNDGTSLPDEIKVVDFKTAQLQSIMNRIVANAFKENKDILVSSLMEEFKSNKAISSTLRGELTEDVMKQLDLILKEQEERDEARFRKLDETIRQLQNARSEVAATRSKRSMFRR
jgi:DNA-binding transcriptional MerR regulator